MMKGLYIFLLGMILISCGSKAQNNDDSILAKYLSPIDTLNPKIGQFIILHPIFAFDAEDNISIYFLLDSISKILKRHPCWNIEIGSHIDCRASYAHNDSLTLERSRNILEYLTTKGVNNANLTSVGYGEHKLINNCACEPNNIGPGRDCTEREHALNRRTEIKIIGFVEGCK